MNPKALVTLLAASTLFGSSSGLGGSATALPSADEIRAMAARFAPVDIAADVSRLPAAERDSLAKMIRAAEVIDALFLEQVWAGNPAMLASLAADETPLGRARLHYFLINKGPWSRLDHHAPFVPGAPEKPAGANYYPADATRPEIEQWLAALAPDDRARATGFFTTIRRGRDGRLRPVPYGEEYRAALTLVSRHLADAAALTAQPTLQRYLSSRASALLTDDYYESDVRWMELDASIEPTIGPYEVYEDEWFNAKAAFEAFITVRDDAETARLARFGSGLQELESNLPVDPRHRNPALGALAPIRVVNVVFAAGDGNRGVQTAAFNLPNDERVIRDKGSKRVMLKNVQEAKFRMVLQPIAERALGPADRQAVSFDAFFTHILMHELMHGLGPHQISVGGRQTTVRQELKETYSAIEEAKADISGLWALQYLVDRGTLDRRLEETMYTTFLASAFRSVRFGVNEAHGRGVAIQLNTLVDAGALTVAADGTFAVDRGRVKGAVVSLTRDILTLQAEGDYRKARAMVDERGVIMPGTARLLERLKDVPVDIEPRFTTARQLLAERP